MYNTSWFNIFHRFHQKRIEVRNRIALMRVDLLRENTRSTETICLWPCKSKQEPGLLYVVLCDAIVFLGFFCVFFFKASITLSFSHSFTWFTFPFLVSSLSVYYERPRKDFSYLYDVLNFWNDLKIPSDQIQIVLIIISGCCCQKSKHGKVKLKILLPTVTPQCK